MLPVEFVGTVNKNREVVAMAALLGGADLWCPVVDQSCNASRRRSRRTSHACGGSILRRIPVETPVCHPC
uniref:Uncharacterized protein n=1 Tax=Arundo donax TaxID=35708 RepID=A0A0A9AZW8_ARUDO